MQDMGRTAGRKARPASPAERLMEDQLSRDTITVRPIAMTKTARLPDESAMSTPSAGIVPLDKVMQFLKTFAKEFREDMATTTTQLLTTFDKRLSSVEDHLARAEREINELRTSNNKLTSEVSRCVSVTTLAGGMSSGGESPFPASRRMSPSCLLDLGTLRNPRQIWPRRAFRSRLSAWLGRIT